MYDYRQISGRNIYYMYVHGTGIPTAVADGNLKSLFSSVLARRLFSCSRVRMKERKKKKNNKI